MMVECLMTLLLILVFLTHYNYQNIIFYKKKSKNRTKSSSQSNTNEVSVWRPRLIRVNATGLTLTKYRPCVRVRTHIGKVLALVVNITYP